MSYGIVYQISFKTLSDNAGLINLLQKGYSGSITQLKGTAQPIVISYKSGDYYATDSIRGSEADISFYNQGATPLSTFEANSDNVWRVDYYLNSNLEWSGFLVMDDCREALLGTPTVINLKANDGLGLLKDVAFTDLTGSIIYYGGGSNGTIKLLDVLNYCLYRTGLLLPTNNYLNMFEVGMNDRTSTNTNDPFAQAYVDPRMYLLTETDAGLVKNSANPVLLSDIVKDCYTVLQSLLADWNCTIFQNNGQWNIVRWVELKDFSNNPPGTQYQMDASTGAFNSPSVAPSLSLINIGSSESVKFINASQTRYFIRPNSYVNNQFNYQQPQKLILNMDLMTLGSLVATSYATINGVKYKYEDYLLPDWTFNGPSYISYIRKVSDTRTNLEVDRFIYMPLDQAYFTNSHGDTDYKNIQFNDILVSQNSRMDFSADCCMQGNIDASFCVSFNLQSAADPTKFYELALVGGSYNYFRWNGPYTSHEDGKIPEFFSASVWSPTNNNYNTFSLSGLITAPSNSVNKIFPAFPVDGILKIRLYGFNFNGATATTCYVKNLSITMDYYINQSTKITGHYNKSSIQNASIRKNISNQLTYSDSPVFSINGALLVGGTTKTAAWKNYWNMPPENLSLVTTGITSTNPTIRKCNVTIKYAGTPVSGYTFDVPAGTTVITFASLGLADLSGIIGPSGYQLIINYYYAFTPSFGFVQTVEKMFLTDALRTKVDCDLKGVGFGVGNVFEVDELSGLNFILGQCEFDIANETMNGTLEELWNSGETFDPTSFDNEFNYLYS